MGKKKLNNAIHSSTKKTPIQISENSNEKIAFGNLKDKRAFQKPKIKLGQLFRTADIKREFSKGDSRNWSYILYTQKQKSYTTQDLLIETTI